MNLWNDPVNFIALWLSSLFVGWGAAAWLASLIIQLIGVVVLISIMMVFDIFLVWVERKVVGALQDRLGPNRVGPFGIIQPLRTLSNSLSRKTLRPMAQTKWFITLHRFFL